MEKEEARSLRKQKKKEHALFSVTLQDLPPR